MKRILAIAISGTLLFLVACQGGNIDSGNKSSQESNQSSKADDDTPENASKNDDKNDVKEIQIVEKSNSASEATLEGYFQAVMSDDEEAALKELATPKGEGALPEDYFTYLKAEGYGVLDKLVTALDSDTYKAVTVSEMTSSKPELSDFYIYFYETEDTSQAPSEALTIAYTTLFDDEGKIAIRSQTFDIEIPQFTKVYFNGKAVEADKAEEQSSGLTLQVYDHVQVGKYTLSFADSYMVLEDLEFEVKHEETHKRMRYFGQEDLKAIDFRADLDEKIVTDLNTLASSLFESFNNGDITVESIPETFNFTDDVKANIVESINKMNGMNKGIVKGERVFKAFEKEARKIFTAKDAENFYLEYEFGYDAGSAKNLTQPIIVEGKYLGEGAFEYTKIAFGR